MKKKIVYFSPDCFLDVDMPVLSGLAKSFDIEWIVLYTYKPEFYKYSPDEILAFAAESNIKIKIFTRKYRLRNSLNMLLLVKMFAYISQVKPGMIYFTAEDDFYFSILATIFLPVSKTVKGVHNVILHEKYNTGLKKLSHDLLRRRFKYFHFFSTYQAEHFKKRFQLNDFLIARLCNVHKNHSGTFSEKEKQVTHFIFFGKITHYKGVDLLIKAANKLANDDANFKVTIAGRCNNWQPYEELIKAHKQIHLNIRMVGEEQLSEYLYQCHFVVLPYRSVTQSGVIAMYYNSYIPAIASDLDGFKEYMVDGLNGLSFASDNVDALYQAMKKAIDMKNETYNALRKNVKKFVETELNREIITEKYSSFFNSVIERAPGIINGH